MRSVRGERGGAFLLPVCCKSTLKPYKDTPHQERVFLLHWHVKVRVFSTLASFQLRLLRKKSTCLPPLSIRRTPTQTSQRGAVDWLFNGQSCKGSCFGVELSYKPRHLVQWPVASDADDWCCIFASVSYHHPLRPVTAVLTVHHSIWGRLNLEASQVLIILFLLFIEDEQQLERC